jgi:HPt (histidine-containing phosphotransfer) domain-containing protein
MFGEHDAVIDELLVVFQQSLPPLRERLRREVLQRGGALKPITHELRGAAANIGALPLAEFAGRLESLAASDNWGEIDPLAARIDQEFDRINSFVSRYAQCHKV